MKHCKLCIVKLLPGAIFLFSILSSCKKESPPQKTSFFITSEKIKTLSAADIKLQFQLVSILQPEASTLAPETYLPIDIYKITYNTKLNDTKITASGIVSIPQTEGSYPIISFQNGTNTCNANAPSNSPSDPLFSLIGVMASGGYIISTPDYIGFGSSENILHPYYHAASSNNAVIDMLKAIEEFLDVKSLLPKTNKEIFLMGYSQGGWATLAAAKEMELSDVKVFTLKAAACGAGAYNLSEMSKYILSLTNYGNPFYLPYFIESRRQNNLLSDELSLFFNEPYASNIPGLFDGTKCNTEMNSEFSKTMSELLTSDLIQSFETNSKFENLRAELKNNSVIPWNSQVNIKLYHSIGDSSVPVQLTESAYQDFLIQGTDVAILTKEIVQNDKMGHSDAVLPWGIDALLWINSLNSK